MLGVIGNFMVNYECIYLVIGILDYTIGLIKIASIEVILTIKYSNVSVLVY